MGVIGTPGSVTAQAFTDLQTPDTPLVLKAQGSFFVGGEKAEQTQVELGSLGPGGHIAVNQMYVRYMVPQGGDGNVPVVMVHGATLTGKSWETTLAELPLRLEAWRSLPGQSVPGGRG